MVTRFIVERERGECDVENWFLSTQSGLMDSLRVFYETSLYITCTSSVTNNNVSDSVTSNCSLFDEDIIAVSVYVWDTDRNLSQDTRIPWSLYRLSTCQT